MSVLKSLFGAGSRDLVGLDISSSAVKLLEFSRRADQVSIEAFAVEPLPDGAVADKQVAEPEVVGEAIARAIGRSGTRTRGAAVAVSGSAVITKTISMPEGLGEHDMEEQIKAEADQYIPYPIEEVNLDFQVLGPSVNDSDGVDVLLAACRKEQVDNRLAALEIAGLKPMVVDVEAYALENACQFLTHQMPEGGVGKTVAIVDMGATTTSVLVLNDLKLVYTREQAFGGRQLTEDIMRYYDMSVEEAGKAKRFGNLPESYHTDVLPRYLDDMAQQVDRSLQFYFSSAIHTQIDQVILAGGCAHIDKVDEEIRQRLNYETVIANPFAHMAVSGRARTQQLARDEASLLLACGLAYRTFDEAR